MILPSQIHFLLSHIFPIALLLWFFSLAYLLNACTLHFFTYSTVQGRGPASGWVRGSGGPVCLSRLQDLPQPLRAACHALKSSCSFTPLFFDRTVPSVQKSRLSAFLNSSVETLFKALLIPLSEFLSFSVLKVGVPILHILCSSTSELVVPVRLSLCLSKHCWWGPQYLVKSLTSFYADASTISNIKSTSQNINKVF